jgi:hypothetical protein
VEQVRDEMAAFPHGESDDPHDAAVYGLLRIRQGGLMRLSTDLEANISRGGRSKTIEPSGGFPGFRDRYALTNLTTLAMKARSACYILDGQTGYPKSSGS